MVDINTKIETHRLILRPYGLDDLNAHTAILGDGDVASWLSSAIPFPYNLTDGEKHIEMARANFIKGEEMNFSIIEKETNRHIGGLKLFSCHKEESEIGYWLGKEFWGKGFGFEIRTAAIMWTQKATPIRRLVAQTANKNIGSRKLLEKLKFQHFG